MTIAQKLLPIWETHQQLLVRRSDRTKTVEQVHQEILAFTEAARKELGIVHIDSKQSTWNIVVDHVEKTPTEN